jgi:GT2 family glycosyltransferase
MFSNRGYGNRSQRHLFAEINNPVEVFGACGAGAVYRREILKTVGYFNEEFFFLFEDLELSFRHQLLGHRCLYIPSAVIYHIGSSTLHKVFTLAVKEAVKNSLTTLITCAPSSLFRNNGWAIVKFYVSFLYHLMRKGYWKECVDALLYVGVNFHRSLKKRKCIQSASKPDIQYFNDLLYRGDIHINFPDEIIKL